VRAKFPVGGLGDADGDGDDFRTRDGRALATSTEFETLHKNFAKGRRMSRNESLWPEDSNTLP